MACHCPMPSTRGAPFAPHTSNCPTSPHINPTSAFSSDPAQRPDDKGMEVQVPVGSQGELGAVLPGLQARPVEQIVKRFPVVEHLIAVVYEVQGCAEEPGCQQRRQRGTAEGPARVPMLLILHLLCDLFRLISRSLSSPDHYVILAIAGPCMESTDRSLNCPIGPNSQLGCARSAPMNARKPCCLCVRPVSHLYSCLVLIPQRESADLRRRGHLQRDGGHPYPRSLPLLIWHSPPHPHPTPPGRLCRKDGKCGPPRPPWSAALARSIRRHQDRSTILLGTSHCVS